MSDWRSLADPEVLRQRARLLAAIRAFLDQRGVVEVQTPVITASGITDLHIDSIALGNQAGYLRTSPEYAHKRLLASGMADIYELGPVFRAGEQGQLHRTEFCLLEWYRRDWSWRQLAAEVTELLNHCLEATGRAPWPVRHLAWRNSFVAAGLPDPLEATISELTALTETLPPDCDRDMRLDYLFATRIQPAFARQTLTVVHGYPASQAALARLDPNDPRISERFEVFAGPIELANGYRELTDATEQRKRFQIDNERRKALGRKQMPLDERLLAALESGLPECAGVAVGVDRLIMAVLGITDIKEVIAFSDVP